MSAKLKKLIIISSVIAAVIAIAAGVTVYLLDFSPVDTEAAAAARMAPVTASVSSSVRSAGLVEAGMASTAVTTQPGNR